MSELTLKIDDVKLEPQADLDRLRLKVWMVGGVAAAVLLAGYFLGDEDKTAFFRAYLVGWLFTLGLAAGLNALNMLNHLSGGDWGVVMRRVLEAAGRTLPFVLLLGLPLVLGVEELYSWARPEAADDPLIAKKAILLNKETFLFLSAAILLLWSGLGMWISSLSHKHDATGDENLRRSMARISAAGIILYILSGTLGAVLWIMSLDPHWFSSLFGVVFVEGQVLSALALSVPILIFLTRRQPLSDILPAPIKTKLFHDYGKLMLAFVALWAYFAVSQFLIIWSGNLPEEVTWYLERSSHGWKELSVFLVLGQFVLPFVILLSQDLKKKPGRLVWVAVWILFIRWFDLFWQVTPSIEHDAHAIWTGLWLDLAAPIALGGIWLGLLLTQLKNRALVPVAEPNLKEVLAHG